MNTPTDSDLDEHIAVFHHALISRLLPKDLSAEERRRERRRIFATEHQIPDTARTHVAEVHVHGGTTGSQPVVVIRPAGAPRSAAAAS